MSKMLCGSPADSSMLSLVPLSGFPVRRPLLPVAQGSDTARRVRRDQRLPADDAATDQEQQAQAVGLFLTDSLLEI
jgi:hypothetical protein